MPSPSVRGRRTGHSGRRPSGRGVRDLLWRLRLNWVLLPDHARSRVRIVGVGATGLVCLTWGFGPVGREAMVGPSVEGVPARAALPVLPDLSSRALRASAVPLAYLVDPSLSPAQMDDLLTSAVLRDPEFARAVHGWIEYWSGPAAQWFPGFLDRMAVYGPMVDSALAAKDFPPSIRYLPLIESGYDPRVTSRASAVGMWQLMPATARELGLEVTPVLDERRHPERSTEAAILFLEALHEEFGSWHFALAAYNGGPARARRILRRNAPGARATDSLFWSLRAHFPRETREFLPKLYGAMWVASQPEAYGFSTPVVVRRAFDEVYVPDRATLDVVALAAGVEHEDLVALNPEYIRGVTPEGRESMVRVPVGTGRTFRRIFPRILPADRVTFATHEVRPGETLSQIARRYGLSIGEIEAANPRENTRTLGVGSHLIVPVLRRQ